MQRKREHFVSILVRHDHLSNYLLDILISSLNCPIHLGPVRRIIMVLDLEILTHLLHHPIVEIGGIISDNLPGKPTLANYLLFDEPNHHTPSHTSVRSWFDPFGEVVNGD